MDRVNNFDDEAGIEPNLLLFSGRWSDSSESATLQRAVDLALFAEQVGWPAVWVTEHHLNRSHAASSSIALAAYLLGRTSNIVVGTAAVVLPLYSPVTVAEQAAQLDLLSCGRFRLGIARGPQTLPFSQYGTSLARRNDGFAHDLDTLLRALRGEPLSLGWSGDGVLQPQPLVPQPTSLPPVALACNGTSCVEWAATRGLSVMLGIQHDDTRRRQCVETYRAIAPNQSEEVPHYATALLHFSESSDEGRAELEGSWAAWNTTFQGNASSSKPSMRGQLLHTQPIGTSADIVRSLSCTKRLTGIRRFLFIVDATGNHDEARRNIARFASEVQPNVSRIVPAAEAIL